MLSLEILSSPHPEMPLFSPKRLCHINYFQAQNMMAHCQCKPVPGPWPTVCCLQVSGWHPSHLCGHLATVTRKPARLACLSTSICSVLRCFCESTARNFPITQPQAWTGFILQRDVWKAPPFCFPRSLSINNEFKGIVPASRQHLSLIPSFCFLFLNNILNCLADPGQGRGKLPWSS